MAFHQPLLPVLPVARELLSKTKLIPSSKAAPQIEAKGPPPKLPRAKALSVEDSTKLDLTQPIRSRSSSPSKGRWRKGSHQSLETSSTPIMSSELTVEPETLDGSERFGRSRRHKRKQSLLSSSSTASDLAEVSSLIVK